MSNYWYKYNILSVIGQRISLVFEAVCFLFAFFEQYLTLMTKRGNMKHDIVKPLSADVP